MPDWSVLIPEGLTALQAVAIITAIGLLIWLAVKLWPFVKNAVAIVDALVTLPATAKAVAGLTDTVKGMNTQIEGIHHETHKNDGSSIKDAVGRVESGVAGLYREVGAVKDEIVRLQAADDAIRGELDEATSGTSGSTRRSLRAARERERRTITAGDIPPRPFTE